VRLAACLIAITACLPGHRVRTYPRWVAIGGRDLRAGCAVADAFVRKSGKEGLGVTVEVRSLYDCDARIDLALIFPDGRRATAPSIDQKMIGRSLAYLWMPIRFDGDAAWNDGAHTAQLELDLHAGDTTHAWKIPVEHRWSQRWRDQ